MNDQKKNKILLIADHLLSSSGVGTQARWLSVGLVNKGRWTIQELGGAVKHTDYRTVKVNDDLVIKPVDGFGSKEMIRLVLATEKPDAVLLFQDPRFFMHIFEMESEIHQVCPIAFNTIWDAGPDPEFNRPLYESVDLLNCINDVAYEFCSARWPEKTNFIPHAVPTDVYKPLPEDEIKKYRHELLRGRCDDHFVGLWVNRNARRKQPGDVMMAWKMFLDQLEEKHGHRKATLVMHTDPRDKEGANLFVVADLLGIKENVFFSTERFDFAQMNILNNIADFAVTLSSAEGWGLMTHEMMQCGKPIIALKTGGLIRQVVDPETGYEHGVAIEPEVKCLVGSQLVPYIYDHYVSHETVRDAIMKLYEYGPDKRKEIGDRARQYVLKNFSLDKLVDDWDKTLGGLIDRWKADRQSVYRPWEVRSL